MDQILQYIRGHRRQHLAQLFDLLRIPSVSTLPERAEDVKRCAQFLADDLQAMGMRNVNVMSTNGHPAVYAEWLEAPDAPTILIYGHYDVQPPDPLDLWESPPFDPQIRDGEIYARGSADDKGQAFAYFKAIEAYLSKKGSLPVNVKLLIEGEEEIGSAHTHKFVYDHLTLLQADAILLSDNSMFARGIPAICCGTRGLVACQIELESAARDLHSGAFGGVAENPIQVLADILSALKDDDERITIPGFYDDVLELSAEERQYFAGLPFDGEALQQEIGVRGFVGEKGFTPVEREWARPALDINGILGGFTGPGAKTIIPAKAMAKITMRLVSKQNPDKILQAAKDYISSLAPESVKLSFSGDAGGTAYLTPLDHPVLKHVAKAVRQSYGREPLFTRTGGSIGILSTFSDALRIPIAMVGLSYPDDNIHAPNEHLAEEAYYSGIETAARLFNELKNWDPGAAS
ncbi:peptidase M20 [candidate division KSB3 bacterium]|uniref:Peptidase M20 n=1 Tax=candidate division KSB3 bacterium TaxID=2044937 RepID=A0A2G6E6A1_9BACT|nr:MAG: peptidase M20 [candidate division KSB3 bacterium]PIE29992.1 MAG: peptidase M20 [candidate division KSB3 bacterium]